MGSLDLGIQKSLFESKATMKASVSDVFRTMRFTGTTDFAGQKSITGARWESRQFKIAFSYRFGNAKVKAARQRSSGAEDEMKRTQGGGNAGVGISQ